MALIRQKGRKTWQCRIWIPALKKKKSFSTGTSNKNKALRIQAVLLEAVRKRAKIDDAIEFLKAIIEVDSSDQYGMFVDDASDEYRNLPNLKISDKQLNATCRAWLRFCEWLNKTWPDIKRMDQITPKIAIHYWNDLQRSGLKGKTCNNMKGYLSTLVKRLQIQAEMKENPFSFCSDAPTDDSLEGRALTEQEVKEVLNVVEGEWHGAVIMSLYTGLRLGDISKLSWEHISDNTLVLMPSKTRRHKTTIYIPLHKKILKYLDAIEVKTGLIFPEIDKDCRWHDHSFSKILAAASVKASKGKYISFHSLRHTFATRLAANEVQQHIRMKLGGWKNETVAELYNHDVESLKKAINSLD